jgi:hypothetical protein
MGSHRIVIVTALLIVAQITTAWLIIFVAAAL